MKLSVITINYNNAAGLERTIKSVVCQSFADFEYIVIDGASTDNSVEVIKKYSEQIDYWVSEPDKGIYNAMNKGIKQATGEYLLFINSGDSIYKEDVFAQVFEEWTIADIIYCDLQRVFADGSNDVATFPDHINIPYIIGGTLPHPTSYIKKSLFDKYGYYREDLQIVSDWAFFLKVITFGRVVTLRKPIVAASFMMDGMSCQPDNAERMSSETERVFKDYFSPELLQICNNYNTYHNFYNKKLFVRLRKAGELLRRMPSKSFWKELIYGKRINSLIRTTNRVVREQRKHPETIPIIIVNYNRLADLKKLVSFLLERKHKNIVIVDNRSSYQPLLSYYDEIRERGVTVKIMDRNYKQLVFWLNKALYDEYSQGYYIVTDSDIIPNDNMPDDYLTCMMNVLDAHKEVTKVGFAIRIDDIPDTFSFKEETLGWEKEFWEKEVGKDMYLAGIDTTFALYPPQYRYHTASFFNAIRMAGDYTAKHGGYYIDVKNLSDEDIYYKNTATEASSWKRAMERDEKKR